MSSWKRLTAMHGMMGLVEERMKAGNELLETTNSFAWDDGTKRKEDEGSNEPLETTDSYAWDDGTSRREDEGRQ